MTLGRARLAGRALVIALAAGVALLPAPWGPAAAALAVASAVLLLRRRAETQPPRDGLATAAREEAGLAPVLDRLVEGVLILDSGQTVQFANPSAAAVFGRPRAAMLHTSLIRATREAELVRIVREADGVEHEITLDAGLTLRVTAAHLPDGRTVITLLDRTAQRRAERARQDLVANISHELRTPITAARALAETLAEGVADEAHRTRFHAQLAGEVDRMQEIVGRLIRLSRIEQGGEVFEVRREAAGGLVHEAFRRMAPSADRAGVVLASPVADGSGPFVAADRERILEVLTNVLDNAIKFSPVGGTVTAGVEQGDAAARFWVRDEGPGIMPNERLRVFERFYTSDHARSEGGPTGTGLGLSIARQIVTRHGGDIWVADESPGTTVCFTVPLAPAETASA